MRITAITGRQGLAIVRAVTGTLLLVSAADKLGKGWMTTGQPMTQTIQQNLEKSETFYRPILEGTVLPQAGLFAQLVTIGEFVAGTSLLLGLFTRIGAAVCMWLMLQYMMMKGTLLHGYMSGQTYSERIYFVAGLAFFLAAAGLALGLDGALGRWLSRIPVLAWFAGYRAIPEREPVAPHLVPMEPTPIRRREEPPLRRAA
jgi:uncharacterized membrane protein YphA (DoxX/SURF4 family)